MTQDEQYLLDQVEHGQDVEFKNKTNISARFLRDHILEIAGTEIGASPRQGCPRWVIHNAAFAEQLDLSDGRRSGGAPLPAIEFHGCEFRRGFIANGARVDRLLFDGCAFTSDEPNGNFISLRNCHVDSELRIENIEPFVKADDKLAGRRLLWVDAFAITIGTNMVVQDTLLRAPEDQSPSAVLEPRYALDLSTATIHCDLQLQPGVTLEGGLKMRDARIGGTVWGQGLHATDGETDESRQRITDRGDKPRGGFRAQGAHIRGNLALGAISGKVDESVDPKGRDPVRFWCEGEVDLTWLQLEGTVELSGAFVGRTADSHLDLYGARLGEVIAFPQVPTATLERIDLPLKLVLDVEQFIRLDSCRISGRCDMELKTDELSCAGLSVEGNLTFRGTVQVLNAAGLDVRRDTVLALNGLDTCNLGGANVKGKLDISDTLFSKKESKKVSLRDADIGHMLVISPLYFQITSVRQWSLTCYPGFTLSEILLPEDESHAIRTASFLRKRKDVRLLTGDSAVLHTLNRSIGFRVQDEKQAREYLRLFSAYTWADKGAFTLIERTAALPGAFRGKVEIHPVALAKEKAGAPGEVFFFDSYVRYGLFLYKAQFEVRADGGVKMVTYELVKLGEKDPVVYEQSEVPEYAKPFRIVANRNNAPDFASEAETRIAPEKFMQEVPDWSERLVKGRLSGVHFDLRDSSCGTLDDNAGRVWEGAPLAELEEFTYGVMFLPPRAKVDDEEAARLRWLSGLPKQSRRQRLWSWGGRVLKVLPGRFAPHHDDDRPFRAQPYTQLSKALRQRGDDEAARTVEAEKIRLAAYDRASTIPGRFAMFCWWWPYGFWFRFGLSPVRAFGTLLLLWSVGFFAIKLLDENDLLQANVNTVASAVVLRPKGDVIPVVPQASGDMSAQKLPCGESIAPALYAAELLIPILNLHQVGRCDIRREESQDEHNVTLTFRNRSYRVFNWMVLPRTWEYARFVYLVIGSIVTSLALLTFSGIARRWER